MLGDFTHTHNFWVNTTLQSESLSLPTSLQLRLCNVNIYSILIYIAAKPKLWIILGLDLTSILQKEENFHISLDKLKLIRMFTRTDCLENLPTKPIWKSHSTWDSKLFYLRRTGKVIFSTDQLWNEDGRTFPRTGPGWCWGRQAVVRAPQWGVRGELVLMLLWLVVEVLRLLLVGAGDGGTGGGGGGGLTQQGQTVGWQQRESGSLDTGLNEVLAEGESQGVLIHNWLPQTKSRISIIVKRPGYNTKFGDSRTLHLVN